MIVCDPPRIYPPLPEYTILFNNYDSVRSSQNLPPPPSPEYTILFNNYDSVRSSQNLPPPPPSQNIPSFSTNYDSVRSSQNLPPPPASQNIPSFSTTMIVHPPPPFKNYNIMRPSKNPLLPLSQNIPLFSTIQNSGLNNYSNCVT